MRSGTAVGPTGPNADARKRQRGRNAARSAYGWQCDMIGIPAVRHSDTEPIKRTSRPIFIYRSSDDRSPILPNTASAKIF